MTTIHELELYKDRLAGLPPEHFIGSILWYSIAGEVTYRDGKRTQVPVRVTRTQLEAWFRDLGLDPQFLPPPIIKVDAFRKASSDVKRSYLLPDGREAELYVDEVDSNDEFVLRHIMRKVRDPRQPEDEAKLRSEFMATLKFFRGGRSNTGKRHTGDHYKSRPKAGLNGDEAVLVGGMLDDIETRYTDLSANLTEDKIRAVMRRYLAHLNAISVKRSGAMYFVHNTRQDTLDALQELVQRIGQGCTLDQIPLVDSGQSRNMLTEAFQDEVEDDVRLLLTDIARLNEKVKGGKVKAADYTDVNARYQQVASRSEEYARVLGLAQGRAASALELALTGVMSLATRIDHKGA